MSADASDHERVRPEPPKTYYEGTVRTPGFGDAPDRCRALTPVGFCDHGHTVLGRSSCGVRYCPDHWRDWAEDAVISMVARMAAYRCAVDGAEKRVSHVVASPPQDRRYSRRALWETRSEAYDALDAAGVRGGPVVTHPYRTNERANNLYETAVEEGDVEEDSGRWRFLREISDDWDDMSRYIEAAPHYHVPIAPAKDVQPEGTGDWVVKRIRTMQAFHLRDSEAYRDMVASAYYVLTHGAVQEGRATTTYFGEVHPNSFKPEEELTAAAWDRIQTEAEKAVTMTREEAERERESVEERDSEGVGTAGPDECPRDGCEAAVHDVYHLREYLRDDEWTASVRERHNGPKRLAQLRGVQVWWDGVSDRPPPGSTRTTKTEMREWLAREGAGLKPGESRRSSSRQVGLETAVMS
jgi:hypothetical protein